MWQTIYKSFCIGHPLLDSSASPDQIMELTPATPCPRTPAIALRMSKATSPSEASPTRQNGVEFKEPLPNYDNARSRMLYSSCCAQWLVSAMVVQGD